MDFWELKNKASKLKESAMKASKSAVEYSAAKLADSKLTLTTIQELELFLKKSLTTTGKDSSTWKQKQFQHQVIVIFTDIQSEFFRHMLYKLPVLSAKAFSQNISIRLADISMKDLDTKKYQIWDLETLVIIQDEKVLHSIAWSENIQKIVKSMTLDINKAVAELN